jgi:hypothetical protein
MPFPVLYTTTHIEKDIAWVGPKYQIWWLEWYSLQTLNPEKEENEN